MPSSASLADYRGALTHPGALVPVIASAVGRLPIGMFTLATLLYVQRSLGSFAAAGLVSAGVLAGTSIGSVAQGRVMDRLGATRPLLVVALLFALAGAALVTAVETGRPLPLLVTLAVLVGLVLPALEGASRRCGAGSCRRGHVATRPTATRRSASALAVFLVATP